MVAIFYFWYFPSHRFEAAIFKGGKPLLYILFSCYPSVTGINCYGDNQSIIEPALGVVWNVFSARKFFSFRPPKGVEASTFFQFLSSDIKNTLKTKNI